MEKSYAQQIPLGGRHCGRLHRIGFRGRTSAPAASTPAATGLHLDWRIYRWSNRWRLGQRRTRHFNGFDPFTGTFINASLGGTPSGVVGGAHVGYQVQINQWVLGVEGSVDGTSLRKTAVASFPFFLGGTTLATDTRADIQGSIRANS